MRIKKLIFAFVIVTMVLTISILPAFSAVPTGRSGVNFAQVNDGVVYVSIATLQDGEEFVWHVWDATWNNSIGGFVVRLPQLTTFVQGEVVRVYVNVRPNYPLTGAGAYDNNLFEYMQIGQLYYADAFIGFDGTNLYELNNRKLTFFSHPTSTNNRVKEYEADGTHALSMSPYQNNASIDEFMIEATVPTTITTETLCLFSFSILQNNAIFNIESASNGTSHNETFFTPFNPAWFNITENESIAYQNGYSNGYNQGYAEGNTNRYDEGYQDGASDASGGVIQRWGAFLLTAVNGFLSFELIPGFPLWGLLAVAVAVPLLLTFLKLFAGG